MSDSHPKVIMIGEADPFSRAIRMILEAEHALAGSKDCPNCTHRFINKDGGHCYMFETEPQGTQCGQFQRQLKGNQS